LADHLQLAQALSGVRRRNIQNPFTEQSPETWMSPGRDYVAPSSSFFFGPNVQKTSLTTHLPSQVLVDKLLVHYWKAVHPIARTLHRPSFERQYNKFWTDINAGVEPRTSFQAVVFAALLSSAISMSGEKVMTEFAVDKANLVENFKLGAEAALVRANFLQTTKLETLQGFVMYLVSPLSVQLITILLLLVSPSFLRLGIGLWLSRHVCKMRTSAGVHFTRNGRLHIYKPFPEMIAVQIALPFVSIILFLILVSTLSRSPNPLRYLFAAPKYLAHTAHSQEPAYALQNA
jgi:hypothetical protein